MFMTAAKKLNLISVDDYLAGELVSPIKHEYLGGRVHAMAGRRNMHNLIRHCQGCLAFDSQRPSSSNSTPL